LSDDASSPAAAAGDAFCWRQQRDAYGNALDGRRALLAWRSACCGLGSDARDAAAGGRQRRRRLFTLCLFNETLYQTLMNRTLHASMRGRKSSSLQNAYSLH
jgi:hypothetical protein